MKTKLALFALLVVALYGGKWYTSYSDDMSVRTTETHVCIEQNGRYFDGECYLKVDSEPFNDYK